MISWECLCHETVVFLSFSKIIRKSSSNYELFIDICSYWFSFSPPCLCYIQFGNLSSRWLLINYLLPLALKNDPDTYLYYRIYNDVFTIWQLFIVIYSCLYFLVICHLSGFSSTASFPQICARWWYECYMNLQIPSLCYALNMNLRISSLCSYNSNGTYL